MATIHWTEHDPQDGGRRSRGEINTNQGAITGSWAAAPLLPDRCTCINHETHMNYPAEGYIESKKPDELERLWRDGICHRCHPELVQEGYAEKCAKANNLS